MAPACSKCQVCCLALRSRAARGPHSAPVPYLKRLAAGSQLAADLATLEEARPPGSAKACVECEMTLPADYPFSPPALRVVRPRFRKQTGFVISGALCMELLTPQGWNATFSMEAILEQVHAYTRREGCARLPPDRT